MAVFYKLYQGTNTRMGTNGKWYARPAVMDTVDTDDLAEAIEEKCTVHAADVVAVIKALVGEMTKGLQAGKRVVLDGFGSFKVGINSVGAESREKFSVSQNVKGIHVVFQPEVHVDTATKKRTKTFLAGTVLKEYGLYDGGAASTGSGSTGSDTGNAGA